jgi:hypothetical protein
MRKLDVYLRHPFNGSRRLRDDLWGDAVLPAGVFNSLPRIDLLQYPNYLALGKS